VRIFNEKGVDELAILDIHATRLAKPPDYALIAKLAAECRMPLCYGGGVTSADQVAQIIGLGVEKVAISAAAVNSSDLIAEAAARVGSQSIAAVMDVKRAGLMRRFEVFTHNGTVRTGRDPVALAAEFASKGAGEIILNSIERDGTMLGYDCELIAKVRAVTSLPMTVVGGAGTFDDIKLLVVQFGLIGVGAASFFVFKGKYRAVLISYVSDEQRDALAEASRPKREN